LNLREDEVQELLERMPVAAGAGKGGSLDGPALRATSPGRGGSLDPPALRVFNLEGEKLYATDKRWRHVEQELLTALRQFHAGHPLAAGMDMEELRDMLPYQIAPRLFRAFVDQLEAEKMVVRDANLLRLPDHKVQLRDEEKGFVERIKAFLGSNPLAPPDVKQIEKEMGIGRARLGDVIRVMERERSIVRVATDLYFLADCVERVKGTLYDHLSEKSDITPASFRDLFGTSRKYTIPLLEYFDREGITIRVGDTRRLKSSRIEHGETHRTKGA